jgi:hypothetical protein
LRRTTSTCSRSCTSPATSPGTATLAPSAAAPLPL